MLSTTLSQDRWYIESDPLEKVLNDFGQDGGWVWIYTKVRNQVLVSATTRNNLPGTYVR